MSSKAIITFEYLVVNSLLIVNALDQEYRMKGYFGCAVALTISYIYCLTTKLRPEGFEPPTKEL